MPLGWREGPGAGCRLHVTFRKRTGDNGHGERVTAVGSGREKGK